MKWTKQYHDAAKHIGANSCCHLKLIFYYGSPEVHLARSIFLLASRLLLLLVWTENEKVEEAGGARNFHVSLFPFSLRGASERLGRSLARSLAARHSPEAGRLTADKLKVVPILEFNSTS